ncbi:MAG: hypothetical protein WBN42_07175, partial [Ignavibacteriaceae bacterium]
MLIAQISYAQWFWQNPLPQGNTLNSVKCISPTVGWAVGDFGTILKTTNGGTTWTQQTSGIDGSLNDVIFTDANTGTAVSSGGKILRTTNGGTTWTQQTSGTGGWLKGVTFTDENNGTGVGD